MTIQQIGAYALAAFFVFAPTMAFAAEAGFVGQIWPTECNCEGMSPGFGCIVLVIDNLMKLAVAVGASATLFAFLYAGYLLITNAFDPKSNNIKKARDLMWRAVIGLCIVLSAYVLVDFVMKAVYDEENWEAAGISGGNWNEGILITNPDLLCIEGRTNQPLNSGTPQNNNGQDNTDNTPDDTNNNSGDGENTCSNCVSVPSSIPHKLPPEGCHLNGDRMNVSVPDNLTQCQLNSTLVSKIQAIMNAQGRGNQPWKNTLIVNEMWPPTRTHDCECHAIGTCLDMDEKNGLSSLTATERSQIQTLATAQGLRAVWESAGNGHFSVYYGAGLCED